MTVNLSPLGGAGAQFFDNNGVILSGGLIYSYAAGTTTPKTTYTSASGNTAHTNPIILNSAGRVSTGEIWINTGQSYKFALYTSTNTLLATWDNIAGTTANASAVEYDPPFTSALTTGYTVQDKLSQYVSVKDFGATGDGTTNDTTAIQNAINYVGSKSGGTILLPAGSYKITSTLSCLYPNILFVGDGSDEPHNIGLQGAKAATKLVWAGASGGTILNIGSVSGVNSVKYSGGGVRSIYFDSGCTINGTGAAYGINLVSYNEGVFENVMFREFQTKGIRVGCVTQLWDARDPQHNRFINCWSRNFVNQSGGLFLLEGDTTMYSGTGSGGTYTLANVSLNQFENCGAQFYNGIAIELKNTDHNFFFNCRCNRITGGTGQGIVFQGSNQRNTNATPGTESSDYAFVARKNVFFGFSGGNEIIAKGTTSYTYPSYKNIFAMIDDSNNTPYPTIETGALCYVMMRTDGVGYYPNQVSGVFSYAASISNASLMALQARDRATTESLRLENRSSDGLRIARPSADNLTIEGEWSLYVIPATSSAGQNLKFTRLTGTGCIEITAMAQYSRTIADGIYTLTNINSIVLVNATAGNCAINLPLAASYGVSVSPTIKIRRIDSSGNTVTVQRQSTDTLNGGTTETLAAATGKTYICDGTANWYSL